MKLSLSVLSGLLVTAAIALGLFQIVYQQDVKRPVVPEVNILQIPDSLHKLANSRHLIERTLAKARNGNHEAGHDLHTLYSRFADNALVRSYRREAFDILWKDVQRDAVGLKAQRRHAEMVLKELFSACEAGAFDERDCIELYKPVVGG